MIKKLYDKCVYWAGKKYAKPFLAFESFIESSFFPIPPDVMIIPMVIAKKNEFINIALIGTIFSVLGALFGYMIGYIFFKSISLVGKERIELSQYCYYWILSPTRLPVPPFAQLLLNLYLIV